MKEKVVMQAKEILRKNPHPMRKELDALSNEDLAGLVSSLFFLDPETTEANYIAKKELAFKIIQMLMNGKKEAPAGTIKSEEDWIRYFHLNNEDSEQ